MRRLALLCSAMLPCLAHAAPVLPADANRWHICDDDIDCKLIEGVCGPTGVNVGHAEDAARYYAEQRRTTECENQFWVPKADSVRCRIGACEAIIK